ncbi:MAG: COG4315 family predicted lipoprotein [Candidatus Dormibacteraceae bacterium]
MPTHQLGTRFAVGLALVAAACGSAAPSSTGTGPPASSPAPSASSAAPVALGQASVIVMGKSETALTTPAGLTLYYLTIDSATQPKCTGACAKIWPPLLSSGTPSSTASLPGKLAVASNPNGSQVTYNGHPLYSYSADSAKGQANGEGVQDSGGTWHVATAALVAGSTAPRSSPSGSGSPYGY